MWSLAVLAITFLISILLLRNEQICNYWSSRGIFCVSAPPFLNPRRVLASILIKQETLKWLYMAGKESGLCGFFQVRTPQLVVADPTIVDFMLRTEFSSFMDKRGNEINEKKEPLSQHLIALSGPKWKSVRSKLTPVFSTGKLRSMHPLLDSYVDKFIVKLEKEEKPVDVTDFAARLSTSCIAGCAFGVDSNCLDDSDHLFIRMGRTSFGAGKLKMFRDHLRILYPKMFKALGIPFYDREASQFHRTFIKESIEQRKNYGVYRPDFVQLLMQIQTEDEKREETEENRKLTDNLIVAQASSFFVGGFETTSTTLISALYELSRRPEIAGKCRAEAETILERDGSFNYDNLTEMDFTDQVIKETLRMHAPTFYVTRICTRTTVIPQVNVAIEAGTQILIPVRELHHDPDLFSNPEIFDPDRFSETRKHEIVPGSYLPFGEGPRKCIGMKFSLLEIKLTLAKVLVKFELSLDPTTPDFKPCEYARTYQAQNPILIRFKPTQ